MKSSSSSAEHISCASDTLVALIKTERRMRPRAAEGRCEYNTMRGEDWLQSETGSILNCKRGE